MRRWRGAAARCVALLSLTLMLSAPAALAQPAPGVVGAQASEPAAAAGRAEELPLWDYGTPKVPWGRLVSGTLLVCALICIGVYVLKKLNGGAPLHRGRYLELLEARPVGRNVQLFLVRVAGRVVLLASGGGTVTRVAELDEEELPQPADAASGGADTFRVMLRKLVGAGH